MNIPDPDGAGNAEAPLVPANARLDEARRVWAAFVAGMSHELRTPLHGILGFTEILRNGKAGPLTATQAEYLGEIIASGEHLLALINDILDLAMIEAGLMELAPERVHLPEALVATLRLPEGQTSQKGLRVTTDLAPEVSTIWADPTRLKQILYHLLSNAITFTPQGGTITISARKRADIADCGLRIADLPEAEGGGPRAERGGGIADRGSRIADFSEENGQAGRAEGGKRRAESSGPGGVPLTARESAIRNAQSAMPGADGHLDQFIEISVVDTGIGMAPEDRATLFEPFGRGGAPGPGEGTRLGLALTRKLVELHGGALRLESPGRGRGTTVTVTLPLPPG